MKERKKKKDRLKRKKTDKGKGLGKKLLAAGISAALMAILILYFTGEKKININKADIEFCKDCTEIKSKLIKSFANFTNNLPDKESKEFFIKMVETKQIKISFQYFDDPLGFKHQIFKINPVLLLTEKLPKEYVFSCLRHEIKHVENNKLGIYRFYNKRIFTKDWDNMEKDAFVYFEDEYTAIFEQFMYLRSVNAIDCPIANPDMIVKGEDVSRSILDYFEKGYLNTKRNSNPVFALAWPNYKKMKLEQIAIGKYSIFPEYLEMLSQYEKESNL